MKIKEAEALILRALEKPHVDLQGYHCHIGSQIFEAEPFCDAVDILLEFVQDPYFTPETVQKEQGIIGQEIRMGEDMPGRRVLFNMLKGLFHSHPVRVDIAGTVESISHIDADMLYACHRAFYTPSNMILCVVGDVEPQEVLDIAQGSTPSEALPAPLRHYGSSEGPGQAVRRQRTMEVSMPTLCMAFRCDAVEKGPASMRRELIGELASEILAGESSPLFSRLYSQGLIDPSFCAGYESIKDLCLLSIYVQLSMFIIPHFAGFVKKLCKNCLCFGNAVKNTVVTCLCKLTSYSQKLMIRLCTPIAGAVSLCNAIT